VFNSTESATSRPVPDLDQELVATVRKPFNLVPAGRLFRRGADQPDAPGRRSPHQLLVDKRAAVADIDRDRDAAGGPGRIAAPPPAAPCLRGDPHRWPGSSRPGQLALIETTGPAGISSRPPVTAEASSHTDTAPTTNLRRAAATAARSPAPCRRTPTRPGGFSSTSSAVNTPHPLGVAGTSACSQPRIVDAGRPNQAAIQARVEAGFLDTIELGPTVQGIPEHYANLPEEHQPRSMDMVLSAPPERIRYEAVHSEEGGTTGAVRI
jgi:NDP-hexose 2,3-dehydratase